MKSKHTNKELRMLQALSLDEKITLTKLRITEFYEYFDGKVVISFSGGKDSTVLLNIARELYPNIKAVYCDTGLEYPEVKSHVKSFDNVDIIRPEISFKQVLDEHGWVYPSKEIARKIYYARKGSQWAIYNLEGKDKNGKDDDYKSFFKKWKYLTDAPFKISDMCCTVMKKKTIP